MSVSLILNRFDAAYVSGEKIQVEVKVSVTEPTKVRAIYLVIKGSGRVPGAEEKAFLNKCVELWKPVAKDRPIHHGLKLAWDYVLSENLPSTFHGKHGHIAYFVEVIVDRVLALDWHEKKEIIVMEKCNLNEFRLSQESVLRENVDMVGYTGINKRPVEATLSLPTHALIARRRIPITINIANHSSRAISRTELRLKQTYVYKGHNQEKSHTHTVFTKEGQGVKSGEKMDWDNITILPAVATTGGCWPHVQISYELEFIAHFALTTHTLKMKCPVVVGTSLTLANGETLMSAHSKSYKDIGLEDATFLNEMEVEVPVGYTLRDFPSDWHWSTFDGSAHSSESDEDYCFQGSHSLTPSENSSTTTPQSSVKEEVIEKAPYRHVLPSAPSPEEADDTPAKHYTLKSATRQESLDTKSFTSSSPDKHSEASGHTPPLKSVTWEPSLVTKVLTRSYSDATSEADDESSKTLPQNSVSWQHSSNFTTISSAKTSETGILKSNKHYPDLSYSPVSSSSTLDGSLKLNHGDFGASGEALPSKLMVSLPSVPPEVKERPPPYNEYYHGECSDTVPFIDDSSPDFDWKEGSNEEKVNFTASSFTSGSRYSSHSIPLKETKGLNATDYFSGSTPPVHVETEDLGPAPPLPKTRPPSYIENIPFEITPREKVSERYLFSEVLLLDREKPPSTCDTQLTLSGGASQRSGSMKKKSKKEKTGFSLET